MNLMKKLHGKPASAQTAGNKLEGVAPIYDWMVNVLTLGREQKVRAETLALAQIRPGDSILDVGCGTGSLALAAARMVGSQGKVFGVDPSSPMIEIAQRKALKTHMALDFQVGVIEDLRFEDNALDVVFSSLMMHHLPDSLKRTGLAEIYRVLRPGGRLVIVELDFSRFSLANLLHHHPANEERHEHFLQRLMEEIGYEALSQQPLRAYGGLLTITGNKLTS